MESFSILNIKLNLSFVSIRTCFQTEDSFSVDSPGIASFAQSKNISLCLSCYKFGRVSRYKKQCKTHTHCLD